MKTIPPACPEPETGRRYWKSLDQLSDTPEFREWLEREFPAGASELADPVSRRHFVKIMSASFALAGLGLTGCRRPEHKLEPFAKQPEGYSWRGTTLRHRHAHARFGHSAGGQGA
jgi:molybdopterin-containing oxidoreductase family iron-sulfur binding subunit